MVRDVIARIERFNQGRIPELVQRKYQAMAQDAFAFLRGTCHLFYEDLPQDPSWNHAPAVWICGDLHLQNFGSFKGDDRLVYFDINDFDESVLAPCTWDVARFLTSVLVGSHGLGLEDEEAIALCQEFLWAYGTALGMGKARSIQRETATGLVGDLLEKLRGRDRAEFVGARTSKKGKKLKLIDNKVTPASEEEQAKVQTLVTTWAKSQSNPEFFEILDIAHRIAGNGSLGVDRYLILVAGRGTPDGSYLLDLKAARPSSLQPSLTVEQPQWVSEAERSVEIQQRCQESPPALLSALGDRQTSYTLRELQPTEDKLDLSSSKGKIKRLAKLIHTLAEITAWGQLRSGGRQGSAIADQLIEFAAEPAWQTELLDYARHYSAIVESDYQVFRQAWDNRALAQ